MATAEKESHREHDTHLDDSSFLYNVLSLLILLALFVCFNLHVYYCRATACVLLLSTLGMLCLLYTSPSPRD